MIVASACWDSSCSRSPGPSSSVGAAGSSRRGRRSLGDSTFERLHRRTPFLIAALPPEFTSDISKSVVPDLRAAIRDAMGRAPGADGFDVMVTGFPALDHDVRTISAEDSERGERRVLPLTLVVLIVAFGALVAAMVPILVGVLAVTIPLGH